MTKPPTILYDDPEFFEKIFRTVQTHGFANVDVTQEQMDEAYRRIQTRRKAAAKERRAKKNAKVS
jgi:hypothetical protein